MASLLRLRPGQGSQALEGTGVRRRAYVSRVRWPIAIRTDVRLTTQIPPALWREAAATELWAAGKEFHRGQVSRGANDERLHP